MRWQRRRYNRIKEWTFNFAQDCVHFCSAFSDDNTIGDTAKTVKAPLGIEVLFATFKEWGYQSLYQEDLCWYDMWGIGLTDLEIKRIPERHAEFRDRYEG